LGSIPIPQVLFFVAITLLIVFVYMKNRLIIESGRNPGKKGNIMEKIIVYGKYVLIAVIEVVSALGASWLASVGPLT
jgi:hypothetical protein